MKDTRKVHLTKTLAAGRSYSIACATQMRIDRPALHSYTLDAVTCLYCKKLIAKTKCTNDSCKDGAR